jgi:hypothetical protein
MRCRFCDERTDLVEAHIIPEGFWRPFRDGGHVPRLLSSDEYPKRLPIGVYDKSILCTKCEPLFGPWDAYAQELLQDEASEARVRRVGRLVVGYEVDEWQYAPLKLFFISLLWRAAVSSHAFFRRITLGPFEDVALGMLREGSPGAAEDFPVVLAKSARSQGRAILDPYSGRLDGLNYATFYLGFYMAYVKVDKRQSLDELQPFVLRPDGPLKILARDLKDGKELPVLQRLLTKPQNRRASRTNAGGRGAG